MKRTSDKKNIGYRIVKVHDCNEFGVEFNYYKVQEKFFGFWVDVLFGEYYYTIESAEKFIKSLEFKKTTEIVKEF